jgi:hypothetical protein
VPGTLLSLPERFTLIHACEAANAVKSDELVGGRTIRHFRRVERSHRVYGVCSPLALISILIRMQTMLRLSGDRHH